MRPAADPVAPPSLEMIERMTCCAYELGVAASQIAHQAKDDTALFLSASAEFRHCFFAVRMGIRLKLAEQAAPRSAAPAERPEPVRADSLDPPERERDDSREPDERERDREYEPVSLPRFLQSLGVAAAQAERRREALPPQVRDTTLPTLQTLLREADPPARSPATAASAIAVLARPPAPSAGRSRLLASTGALGPPPLDLPPLDRSPLGRPDLRRRDSS